MPRAYETRGTLFHSKADAMYLDPAGFAIHLGLSVAFLGVVVGCAWLDSKLFPDE